MSRFDDWKKTQFERRRDEQGEERQRVAEAAQQPHGPEQSAQEKAVTERDAKAHGEALDLHLQMQAGSDQARLSEVKASREATPERAGEQGQGDKAREQAPSAREEPKEAAAKEPRDIGLER